MPGKSFTWLGLVSESYYFYYFSNRRGIGSENALEVRNYLEEDSSNEVNIIISSNGGDAFIAKRMIDLLSAYKSRITVEIVGLVASAGSILAAGLGAKTYVRGASQIMIHAPTSYTEGTMLDHENKLALFKSGHSVMRDIFENNSKLTTEELDSVFSNYRELWFTAAEAVDKGLAAKVLEPNTKVSEIIQELEEEEEDEEVEDRRIRLISKFPLEKLATALGIGDLGLTAVHTPSSESNTPDTEEEVAEKEQAALQAEIDALKSKVATLEANNKAIQAKLDAKVKEANQVVNKALVDTAVAEKKIVEDERAEWMDRLDKGGEVVVGILKTMKPLINSQEEGTSQDKPTDIADIPNDVVDAYRAAKFTDQQIAEAWELDNR